MWGGILPGTRAMNGGYVCRSLTEFDPAPRHASRHSFSVDTPKVFNSFDYVRTVKEREMLLREIKHRPEAWRNGGVAP